MRQRISKICSSFISWGMVVILILMPFHAFFSITIGSLGFQQTLVQSWKEALILLMALAWLTYFVSRNRIPLRRDAINVTFGVIVFLSLLVTLFVHPGSSAVLYGIKTNLVAIALFFIAQIPLSQKSFVKKNLSWLVIVPGFFVAILAVLQSSVISPDLLVNIGYNSNTIDPKQIVDGSLKFYRAFSTLGGPNQLGAYLILPLVFSIAFCIKLKKWWIGLFSIPMLAGIFLSYSRSAWIASVVAVFICIFILLSKKQRIIFGISSMVVAVVLATVLLSQINTNQKLQNVLLHGRYFENQLQGSDSQRIDAIANAAEVIGNQPFGHGLGSAGPASFQSDKPVISENWYLQIAYEIGLLGLLLYLVVFTGLLSEFFRDRKNPLAVALFSATIGILIINMFLHAWADSTLVLIMFGLYGLYRGRNA